jgi:hypothetical protein
MAAVGSSAVVQGYASPYATGGGGTVLEHAYGASFLAALLLQRPMPGLGDEVTPVEVRFQQSARYHVDDLVVIGRCATETRTLFVGVRRDPTIGASDVEFVKLMVDYLRMLVEYRAEFDADRWRMGLAVAGPHTGSQQVRELARLARRQRSDVEFRAAVAASGATTGRVRQRLRYLDTVVAVAATQAGIELGGDVGRDELTWQLLRAFRLLDLRLEGDDPADRSHLVADLALLAGDPAKAVDLWRHLGELSAGYAQAAATVDRALLLRDLAMRIRLRPADPASPGLAVTGEDFREWPPTTLTPGRPPALPSRFVGRPDLVEETISRLVDGPDPVVGLLGMGGAGKSTIARAAVIDSRTQAAFRDGIVWVDVGPSPDVTSCLSRVTAALGDATPVVDVTSGSTRLRDLLASRRCLLILDNVWQFDHLRIFPADGSTRLLVTTRFRDAVFTDADIVVVGPAEPAIGRAILASHAGTTPESLPAEAAEVLTRCGGLVLALALAGGMIAEGYGWDVVAQRLRRADLARLAARFADYPHTDLLAALEACVQSLPDGEQRRYTELAVFEGRGHVPLPVVHELWRATAGMDVADTEDLIVKLARCSLVQLDPEARTIFMHDLLIEYCRTALGSEAMPDLHGVLAEALLTRWGGIERHLSLQRAAYNEDAADRYTRTGLVSHLIAGGNDEVLARLLASEWSTATGRIANAWFTVHERAGGIADYLADIRAWWRHAAARTDADPDGAAAGFTIEARCALIIGSVVSLAANIPPDLLRRLVAEGLWSVQRAMAHVSTVPDPDDRVQALAAVVPLISPPGLPAALAAARSIDKPGARAVALTNVIPFLPAEAREQVVDAALDAALASSYETELLTAVTGLVPHLTPGLLTKALDIMRGAAFPDIRAKGLTVLVPLCQPVDRERVALELVDAARAVDHPLDRAEALANALPYLHGHRRDSVHTEMVNTVRGALPPDKEWSSALATFLPKVPDEIRRGVVAEALTAACAVEYEFRRTDALKTLAPHLDPDLADLAKNCAGQLTKDRERLTVLAHLAPRLPEEARRGTFVRLLRAIRDVDDRYHARAALKELAPHLPDSFLPAAVDIAWTVEDPAHRAETLTVLAPRLPDHFRQPVLTEILAAIRSIRGLDGYLQKERLLAIIPHLPADLLPAALEITRGLTAYDRARVLTRLAPRIPSDLVATVITFADALGDEDDRATVLSLLVAPSDIQDRGTCLTSAFAAARMASPHVRGDCIELLAPHIPPDLMPAAFDLIRTIYTADPEEREIVDPAKQGAIAAIARFVPREQVLTLLDVARTVDSPSDRAEVMTTLARCLPPNARTSALDAALEAAHTLEDPATRADMLADLLPLLPPKVRTGVITELMDAADAAEDVEDVEDVEDESIGGPSLWIRLLPYLKGSRRKAVLMRALSAARSQYQARHRAFWLAKVACHLPDDEARRALEDAVDVARRESRSFDMGIEKLVDLADCLPAELLVTLLNPRGSIDLWVTESTRLSAVAPRLPAELLELALMTARTLDVTNGERAKAITSLLPRFDGTLRERVRQEALDAARAIEKSPSRATALIGLLPCLTGDARDAVLAEALHAAQATTEPEQRAHALIALIPHLTADTLPALCAEALDAARKIPNLESRVDRMSELAPHLPEPLRSEVRAEAVSIARTMNFPSSRAWAAYKMAAIARRDELPDYATARAAIDLASGVGRGAVVDALTTAFDEPAITKAVHNAVEETQRWWN